MSEINTYGSAQSSLRTVHDPKEGKRGKWFFLAAFIFACFLFWWLPSFLFRMVLHQADPVQDGIIATSIIALLLFVAGYLAPGFSRSGRGFSEPVLDACGDFAYKATFVI